jgi:predicted TIM-barrel fold metal-dependent hydrolase
VIFDVHLHEMPADLAPFCEMPWRLALEGDKGPERWLDVPGYSPLTPLDPLLGDFPEADVHVVSTADQMRADLDARGVDACLMLTDRFIALGATGDHDYAVAIAGAYNRYLRERWLDPARGLYGAVLLAGQDPEAAAGELRAYAGVPGVAAAMLSLVNVMPFYGDAFHDPIYRAAAETGLPVVFHGATVYGNVFPYQLQHYDTATARNALAQPLGAIAHLTSLVMGGALARHPDLKVVFCEAGLSWLPFLCARLDGQRRFVPAEAPEVREPPSDYVRRQVWTTTHPSAGEAPALRSLIQSVGPSQVLFGSDWPHYDRDEPAVLDGLDPPLREQLLSENARSLFRLT